MRYVAAYTFGYMVILIVGLRWPGPEQTDVILLAVAHGCGLLGAIGLWLSERIEVMRAERQRLHRAFGIRARGEVW